MIELSKIRIDGGTQSRAALDSKVVDEYAELMQEGFEFPPVTLFYDGAEYWLADGFHRVAACKKAGQERISETINPGTIRDARLFSVSANGGRGLRQSNADKRIAVLMLLQDAEWVLWSNREIAKKCGTSNRFVGNIRLTVCTVHTVEKKDNEINAPKKRKFTTSTGKTAEHSIKSKDEELDPTAEKQATDKRRGAKPRAPHDFRSDQQKELDDPVLKIEMLEDVIDTLREENDSLRNQLSVKVFEGSDAEREEHLARLDELLADNKRLLMLNSALTSARDAAMLDSNALRGQIKYMQRQAKKTAK